MADSAEPKKTISPVSGELIERSGHVDSSSLPATATINGQQRSVASAMDYYDAPVRVITDIDHAPFPRGTNPAYRHLRSQESLYSVSSKRSLLNRIAKGLGAPEPPKLAYDGDKRKSHPDQLYPYDFVAWIDLTPDSISEVLAKLRDQGLAPSTRSASRALLRGVIKESWRMGAVDNEMVERVKSIEAPRYERSAGGKAQPDTVIQSLLNVCDQLDGARDFRDGLLMALLVTTGLRRAEAVNLQLKDVNFHTREIRVTGKGNKDRVLQLTESTFWRLTTYLDRYRGHDPGYIFNPIWRRQAAPTSESLQKALTVRSINHRLKRLIMLAPELTNVQVAPHDLRRTFATNLYLKGMPLRELQIILGHASIATTEHYLFDESKGYRERAATLLADDFAHPES